MERTTKPSCVSTLAPTSSAGRGRQSHPAARGAEGLGLRYTIALAKPRSQLSTPNQHHAQGFWQEEAGKHKLPPRTASSPATVALPGTTAPWMQGASRCLLPALQAPIAAGNCCLPAPGKCPAPRWHMGSGSSHLWYWFCRNWNSSLMRSKVSGYVSFRDCGVAGMAPAVTAVPDAAEGAWRWAWAHEWTAGVTAAGPGAWRGWDWASTHRAREPQGSPHPREGTAGTAGMVAHTGGGRRSYFSEKGAWPATKGNGLPPLQ